MPSKDLEFHTETGRLSLNWIATLGDRNGAPIERILTVEDLKGWLVDVAGQTITFKLGEDDLVEAKRLRSCITGLMDALTSHKDPKPSDINTINEFASVPPMELRLDRKGTQLEHQEPANASVLLGQIARDAIDLVTGRDIAKIKSCAAEDCSVYFVDYSRPGKRRWCSMARCGNQSKKRTFLAKG
ncbi:ABATE domain-containing protein [Ruegeria sp. Ofav3-42]|uniref:CGNR zinc finger domain-containing protein n=1 Tax=Ruegeria sp. Ofav3-42 TaxID=2917759 RepID=UPI001EF4090D|nr:ABATE domain-containing protein [Ruegeria sp. Ofav3-42]MCG7522762.1 CGNR zinc finger domain-containing protein [Ruegeria sp. Ofav3-42]